MRTVEMEALSVTAEEEDTETLSSGAVRPPLTWWRTMLLVAAGGTAGGLLRELVMLLMPTISTPTLIEFPRSTLLVNVVGCVGLGVLTGILERTPDAPRWARPLLGIGLLEGFTIYSGVVLEGSAMIGADFPALAFMYGAITVFGALLGVVLGLVLARPIHRRLARRRPGVAPSSGADQPALPHPPDEIEPLETLSSSPVEGASGSSDPPPSPADAARPDPARPDANRTDAARTDESGGDRR
jgi:CrcB protein